MRGTLNQSAQHTYVKKLDVFYCCKPISNGGIQCDEIAHYQVRNDSKLVIHLCEDHVQGYLQGEELVSIACRYCGNPLKRNHIVALRSGSHYCREEHRRLGEGEPQVAYA